MGDARWRVWELYWQRRGRRRQSGAGGGTRRTDRGRRCEVLDTACLPSVLQLGGPWCRAGGGEAVSELHFPPSLTHSRLTRAAASFVSSNAGFKKNGRSKARRSKGTAAPCARAGVSAAAGSWPAGASAGLLSQRLRVCPHSCAPIPPEGLQHPSLQPELPSSQAASERAGVVFVPPRPRQTEGVCALFWALLAPGELRGSVQRPPRRAQAFWRRRRE